MTMKIISMGNLLRQLRARRSEFPWAGEAADAIDLLLTERDALQEALDTIGMAAMYDGDEVRVPKREWDAVADVLSPNVQPEERRS
jgi:hypothetical protein